MSIVFRDQSPLKVRHVSAVMSICAKCLRSIYQAYLFLDHLTLPSRNSYLKRQLVSSEADVASANVMLGYNYRAQKQFGTGGFL